MTIIGEYSIDEARRLGLIENIPSSIVAAHTHGGNDDGSNIPALPKQLTYTQRANDRAGMASRRGPDRPRIPTVPTTAPGAWAELRVLAETFWDTQDFRKAEKNKLRSATIDPFFLAHVIGAYEKAEEDLRKELVACYRRVVPEPIRAWQEATPGIGDSTLARLLGVIGHPVHAQPLHWVGEGPERHLVVGEPFDRAVNQLWALCGHGDPARGLRARKKASGEPASVEAVLAAGNPKAKTIVFIMAQSAVKTGILHKVPVTPYGELYYETKERYRNRTHTTTCPGGYGSVNGKIMLIRCKHDGHYAEAGDPFQDCHIDAIALRYLGKIILRDLWVAARGT